MKIGVKWLPMVTAFAAIMVEMNEGAASVGVVTDTVELREYSYFSMIPMLHENPHPFFCAWLTVAFLATMFAMCLIHKEMLLWITRGVGAVFLIASIIQSLMVMGYANPTFYSYLISVILVVTLLCYIFSIWKEMRVRS